MYCPICGTQIADGLEKCPNCGSSLNFLYNEENKTVNILSDREARETEFDFDKYPLPCIRGNERDDIDKHPDLCSTNMFGRYGLDKEPIQYKAKKGSMLLITAVAILVIVTVIILLILLCN